MRLLTGGLKSSAIEAGPSALFLDVSYEEVVRWVSVQQILKWHSCLFEFLPADVLAKFQKLNGLQKPTSCLREIHQGSSKKAMISK